MDNTNNDPNINSNINSNENKDTDEQNNQLLKEIQDLKYNNKNLKEGNDKMKKKYGRNVTPRVASSHT
jgi:FtsZ-binding cell division protein ZapB